VVIHPRCLRIYIQSPVERLKWKLLIFRNLKERPWRFNELQQSIDGISQKVLTDSLKQMMSDGLAYRHDYHEQPPRVEYGLTELGTKMLPIVNSLADFGNYYKSIIEQGGIYYILRQWLTEPINKTPQEVAILIYHFLNVD